MNTSTKLLSSSILCLIIGLSGGITVSQFIVDKNAKPLTSENFLSGSNGNSKVNLNESTAFENQASTLQQSINIDDILIRPAEFERRYLAYQLVSSLGRDQLLELWGEFSNISRKSDRDTFANIIILRLAEIDPQSALNLISDISFSEQNFFIPKLSPLFFNWARIDLTKAVLGVNELNNRELQFAASLTILNSRDDLSQFQIADLASQFENPGISQHIIRQQDKIFSNANPELAWNDASNIANDRERSQKLQAIADEWLKKDPVATLAAVLSFDDINLKQNMLSNLLSSWARENPNETLNWINAHSPRQIPSHSISSMFFSISFKQPQLALELSSKLNDVKFKQGAMAGSISGWAHHNPEAVVSWIRDLPIEEIPIESLDTILGEYTKVNPNDAFNLALSLPSEDLSQTMQAIARSLNLQDMPSFADNLWRIQNQEERSDAIRGYVFQWAQKNPEPAIKWLLNQQLETDWHILNAYSTAFGNLANNNPQRAAEIIFTMAPSREKDEAISSVIYLVENNVELQSRLYELINDPKVRRETAFNLSQTNGNQI